MQIDPAIWPTLSDLLDLWLDTPDNDRAAWLQNQERENPKIFPILSALVEAGSKSPYLLKETPFLPPTLPQPGISGSRGVLHADDLIGPYRLIREIGRGGMAVVWLAERADGTLKRFVALKLPVAASHNRVYADRLMRERDILAQLVHPHIARL